MYLLIKDHKLWSEDSGTPIPSRPVLSGNSCINMHLSEMVSELIEPISSRLRGAEISSTEEAIQKFTELKRETAPTKGLWIKTQRHSIP